MPSDADAQGTIRNLIRRLRFDHGEMTQQELAVRVGVTRQTIIALEAGKYVPSLLLAFRLARAFGVSVEGVFQYHDHELNSSAGKVQDDK
jgi:putative transcriptional regulator